MAEILLGRGADGSWVWRYRAPGKPDIVANRTFESREAAAASARRAYPEVPVRRVRSAPAASRIPWPLFVVAGVALAVLVARRRSRAVTVRPVRGVPLEP